MSVLSCKHGYFLLTVEYAPNEGTVLVYFDGAAHQLQLLGDVAGLVHLQHSASGSYPELRLRGGRGGASRSDCTLCTVHKREEQGLLTFQIDKQQATLYPA